MWKQIKNIIAVLLVATFIASLCLNVHFCMMRQESIAASDTTKVTITIFDTIPYPMPVPKDSLVIRYITEKLPISTENGDFSTENEHLGTENGDFNTENEYLGTENGDFNTGNEYLGTENGDFSTENEHLGTENGDFSTENGNIAQENIPDSAAVEIPITQKVYEDSLYRAYVSGYHPSLDSLIIFPRHDITTVTNGYTYKSRQKRWGVGIHVGYGMTMSNTPQFLPYIGIGISYNLITF